MWWGVVINIVAMILVSITNFIDDGDAQPDGANNPALGAIFILLSCIVQASLCFAFERVRRRVRRRRRDKKLMTM